MDFARAGQRREKRARVLLSAKLRTGAGELDVRLRDLSGKGALIECDAPPEQGTEVTFVRGETVVPSRVAWSSRGRAGLEFLRQICEREVLVHVAPMRKAPAEPKSGGRPRINAAGLSLAERRLMEAWQVAVGINIAD
jgi:hypothetical protein